MNARAFLFTPMAASFLVGAPTAWGEVARGQGASCRVVGVSADELGPSAGREPRFSAGQVVGIEFDVLPLSPTPGPHRLELRLHTPQGHLYQTLPASSKVKSQMPKGAREAARPARVRLSVPGSPIVTHSLYGRWEAIPHLDGAEEPCGAPMEFWIDP